MTHTSQNNKSGSSFLCTFHSTNSFSAARKQSIVMFQDWFKRHMNCVFPCPVKNILLQVTASLRLNLDDRWRAFAVRDWQASWTALSLWKSVSHPQRGCQKKQHPSNSHTVTLAGGTWLWKPFGSCLCCSLDPMLIQRWCLADVWYREDVVCGPPPTWLKSSTNALTAGGLPPPQKTAD